jgi:hypothetical protein
MSIKIRTALRAEIPPMQCLCRQVIPCYRLTHGQAPSRQDITLTKYRSLILLKSRLALRTSAEVKGLLYGSPIGGPGDPASVGLDHDPSHIHVFQLSNQSTGNCTDLLEPAETTQYTATQGRF